MDLAAWFQELRRRRVIRALLGWGLLSFAVLQVIEPLQHALGLGEWFLKAVVGVLAVGFPVTAGLAWAFDLRSTGVERTSPAERQPGAPRRPRLRVALLLLGLSAAAGGAVFGLWTWLRPAPPPPSVAVLPFADMSPQHDQEYFADGMAEEILNALAQVEGLHVCGRTSSFSFKGRSEDLRAIGQKLGVATVLEGSVRRAGGRVRITAQLVQTASGFHLWSRTFDRVLSNVISVQEEIAREVVESLKVKLLPGRVPTAKWSKTSNPEAYDQYLRGKELDRLGTLDGYRQALLAYEKALALDPGFAPAWAWAAIVVEVIEALSDEPHAGQDRRAAAAAERAIALAPDLAEGYAARALVRWNDTANALADVERALALSPNYAKAEGWRGRLLSRQGRRPEAIAAARRGTVLEPLDPWVWVHLAVVHGDGNALDQEREALTRALEISPGHESARYLLARNLLSAGRPGDALGAIAPLRISARRLTVESLAQHALGNDEASRAALGALIGKGASAYAYEIAEVHAWRGERDQAFEWLDRAHVQDDSGLASMRTDPFLRRLHDDPRWKPFLRKINLPVK